MEQWPESYRTLDLSSYLQDLTTFTLQETREFTPSQTFSPRPVERSPDIFAFGSSQLTPGVIATILGILCLVVFLFLLWMRKYASRNFQLVGTLHTRDEFDGVELRPEEYDLDDEDPDGEWDTTIATVADEPYSYSIAYEYSYSVDRNV
jgi:hypothetical protein